MAKRKKKVRAGRGNDGGGHSGTGAGQFGAKDERSGKTERVIGKRKKRRSGR